MKPQRLGNRGLAALIRIEELEGEGEDDRREDNGEDNGEDISSAKPSRYPSPSTSPSLPPRRLDLQRAIARLSRRSPLGPIAAEKYIQRHSQPGSEFDIPSHYLTAGDLTSSSMLSLREGKLAREEREEKKQAKDAVNPTCFRYSLDTLESSPGTRTEEDNEKGKEDKNIITRTNPHTQRKGNTK